MGLFSRSKPDEDTMSSRKKRAPDSSSTEGQGQEQGQDTFTEDSSDAAETDVLDENGQVQTAPERREDEPEEAFKARQAEYAQLQLTAAEQQTSALYARRPGESDGDYQSRLDELSVRGSSPAPLDTTYQMPEVPTLGDQRAYLVHYQLATEEEAEGLEPDQIGVLIATHAKDLAARREQAAVRAGGEGAPLDALPLNPSLAQLRQYVTAQGLVPATQVEGMDVAALTALVIGPPAMPPTIDLTAPQAEVTDIPFGGDPPRYFVVLEGRSLYLEGVAVTLRETQILTDRTHDIDQLKRLGVRLIETVNPVSAGSV